MKRKKMISLVCFIMVLMTGISLNLSALANNSNVNPNNSIIYLSNKDAEGLGINTLSKKVTVEKPETIDKNIPDIGVNLCIDSDMLSQANVKAKLNKVYKNGGRIIIKGNDLERKNIRNYFGITSQSTVEVVEEKRDVSGNTSANKNDTRVTIGNMQVGMLIYHKNNINNVTSIYGNENDSAEEIFKAFLYANNYDYIGLAMGNQPQKPSTITFGAQNVFAESYSWSNVDVNTRTDYCERLYINLSLTLDKNADNPNSNNEYLYASTFRSDVDVLTHSDPFKAYAITSTHLQSWGDTSSSIYAYGPLDRSASSANVSFSLPWGISISYNPETKIEIEKTMGGINYNQVAIDYNVKSILGLQGFEHDGMYCEQAVEAYQTSSYFSTEGNYNISTAEYVYTGQSDYYTNYVNYYQGTTFSVSGS